MQLVEAGSQYLVCWPWAVVWVTVSLSAVFWLAAPPTHPWAVQQYAAPLVAVKQPVLKSAWHLNSIRQGPSRRSVAAMGGPSQPTGVRVEPQRAEEGPGPWPALRRTAGRNAKPHRPLRALKVVNTAFQEGPAPWVARAVGLGAAGLVGAAVYRWASTHLHGEARPMAVSCRTGAPRLRSGVPCCPPALNHRRGRRAPSSGHTGLPPSLALWPSPFLSHQRSPRLAGFGPDYDKWRSTADARRTIMASYIHVLDACPSRGAEGIDRCAVPRGMCTQLPTTPGPHQD